MGLLTLFAKPAPTLLRLPTGSFTVDRQGCVLVGTLPSIFPAQLVRDIVQELELILASVEVASPTKEEIHTLVGNAPSLRYLSEMGEGALRNLENQWHKIYIGWHGILGQLKVRQREEESKSAFAGLFGKK